MNDTFQSLLRWQLYFVKNYELTSYLHNNDYKHHLTTEDIHKPGHVAPMLLHMVSWPDGNDYNDLYTYDDALNILQYLEKYCTAFGTT